ncbi:MAG: hypothetical protein AB1898_24885 [Acidobacteriota bacterium]
MFISLCGRILWARLLKEWVGYLERVPGLAFTLQLKGTGSRP